MKAWNLEPEDLGLVRDRDYGAFDEANFIDAYAQGAVQISSEGRGYVTLLVITGPERGHMWLDGRPSDGGIWPLPATDRPNGHLTFFAWYERWLDQSLGQEM